MQSCITGSQILIYHPVNIKLLKTNAIDFSNIKKSIYASLTLWIMTLNQLSKPWPAFPETSGNVLSPVAEVYGDSRSYTRAVFGGGGGGGEGGGGGLGTFTGRLYKLQSGARPLCCSCKLRQSGR